MWLLDRYSLLFVFGRHLCIILSEGTMVRNIFLPLCNPTFCPVIHLPCNDMASLKPPRMLPGASHKDAQNDIRGRNEASHGTPVVDITMDCVLKPLRITPH